MNVSGWPVLLLFTGSLESMLIFKCKSLSKYTQIEHPVIQRNVETSISHSFVRMFIPTEDPS